MDYHLDEVLPLAIPKMNQTKKLPLAKRGVALSVPLIDLLVKERQKTFQLRKELTCTTNQQVIDRAKETIRKEGRQKFVER